MSRKWMLRISIATLVAAGLVTTATVAGATANSDHIWAGEKLVAGASQTSINGQYKLIQQPDGNLVEYQGKKAIWSTGTAGNPGAATFLQKDGNLVVYLHGKAQKGNDIWASNTASSRVSHLTVQNDGNIVIYTKSGDAIWASQGLKKSSGAIEDDYPARWKTPAQDTVYDDWKMLNRECVSFVAFRVQSRNGFNVRQSPNWNAMAYNWDDYFAARTDSKPRPGAVAQTDNSPGGLGHVAWVAKVDGGRVLLEEYNWATRGGYGQRWVDAKSYKYIHLNN